MHIRLACRRTKVQDDTWKILIPLWSTTRAFVVRVSSLSLTDTPANMLLSGVVATFTRWAVFTLIYVPAPAHRTPQYLLDSLRASPDKTIPDILNETFHTVDSRLSRMCEESDGKIHSGCTAVTAFLRIEDADSKQSFLPTLPDIDGSEMPVEDEDIDSVHTSGSESPRDSRKIKSRKSNGGSRIKRALKSLSSSSQSGLATPRSTSPATLERGPYQTNGFSVITPPATSRRVLYSANAGDARGVLCRAGKAVRLTYDHKGSDKQEAKRITDAGGFVMSGRVNGVLAVTRSLGDSSMKEFVVGSPYTTETELCEEDELLILACDGVSELLPVALLFTDDGFASSGM
jgi:protein phosphatase PTC1